jgi:asparagine synthase (glutamine-hydrolysing)
MCGIAGFIDSTLNHADAKSLMQKMLVSIIHRGPDNSSIYQQEAVTFGHNRLTIIDLSESANQPMTKSEVTIIFNGEIYNYLEVRKELTDKGITFNTHGDTEVIIESYKVWGADCVKKFVGMWAFALWDEKKKMLFCSRDRFGIKPFLYIHSGNRFYFGSEYKPLKLSPLFSNDINIQQVRRGLQLGWVAFEDQTYFEKIKALPEACNLIYKDGNITIEKYWDIVQSSKSDLSFEEKRNRFYDLFADSIKLHMRSDVEVGGCLSGGIDSSAITSMVGKMFPEVPFKTFSIYYEGEEDERSWIKSVTEKYPHIVNYDYSPSKDALKDCFHRMSYHLDVPSNWSSDISQYYVMELAAKHKMKVLLDGQGSDEFLGGYLHSFYRLLGEDMKNLQFGKMLKNLSSHARLRDYNLVKSADVVLKSGMSAVMSEHQLYSTEYYNFLPQMLQHKNGKVPFQLENKFSNKLDNFFYHLLFHSMLPSLLHFEDRNSMAFSIESRVPFLDHRLVEFGFTLNNDDRIHNGTTKFILREAVKDIIPQAVYQRKDKKGFSTPGAKWLRGDMKFLLEQDFSKSEMLDQKKVKQVMKEFNGGNDKMANLVWRICGLNYWINNFV